MAITFTDDQLRAISGEALAAPALIAALNVQKTTAQAAKVEQGKKDDGNHAFFDFFRLHVDYYHTEHKHKSGVQRTSYLFATLDDSAAQRPNNKHYPTTPTPWAQMQPKLLAENNGNPTAPFSPYETDQLSKITAQIALLKTGYADGALTDDLTTAYVQGQDIEVDTGGFVVGQRIVIDQANVSLLAIVLAVKPPSTTGAEDLELNVLSNPAVVLGIGARVRNFHAGFSNAEREHTVVPYAPEVRDYWEGILSTEVQTWETTLDGQLVPLNAMDPGGAENTARDNEKTSINGTKTEIDTWQAAPGTGAGVGRYGDTVLSPLEAKVTLRNTDAPARVTAIEGYLGSVSQNPDGSFTGTGHYFSLFKWIDIRASKAGGTLFSFYNFDIIFTFIDKKITTATNQKAEYDAKLLVKKLVEDSDGTAFIKLIDTTGLAISDSVKILSDDSLVAILTRTIIGISGQVVELNSAVPVGYLVDKRARLVKLL